MYVNKLAMERGLKTLSEIGKFLGGLGAERTRVLLDGQHKPQRKTIQLICDKFNVDFETVCKEIM